VAVDGVHLYTRKGRHPGAVYKEPDGELHSYYGVLEAKLVSEDCMGFSLATVFIENEEEYVKQDCEPKAFYRLPEVLKERFSKLPIRLLLDGGRILTRIPKQPAGRRLTKKEKRQFDTEWREPKLYTIYEYDEKGKLRKNSRRYCDGTIGNADDIINLLIAELKINGACQAKEIAFIADGAEWIWNRVDTIIATARIDKAKTVRVLDYYHAVEHLSVFVNNG
jgi:hypothetical protein